MQPGNPEQEEEEEEVEREGEEGKEEEGGREKEREGASLRQDVAQEASLSPLKPQCPLLGP